MNISESTRRLISDLKEFSGYKIRNEDDLSIVIEASERMPDNKLLNDLIFTAKYLNGLGKILRKNTLSKSEEGVTRVKPLDEAAEDKIRREFKVHIQKFSLELTNLIKNLDEVDRKIIESKYLDMTRLSMINMTTLIYDLTWLKKYRNESST